MRYFPILGLAAAGLVCLSLAGHPTLAQSDDAPAADSDDSSADTDDTMSEDQNSEDDQTDGNDQTNDQTEETDGSEERDQTDENEQRNEGKDATDDEQTERRTMDEEGQQAEPAASKNAPAVELDRAVPLRSPHKPWSHKPMCRHVHVLQLRPGEHRIPDGRVKRCGAALGA